MEEWEHEVLVRCIRSLESLKFGRDDQRPKQLIKLKHALEKLSPVLYVSSTLKVLLSTPPDKYIDILENTDVHKTEQELNDEIAAYAFREAAARGRTVHVLPCDSNLHVEIEAKLEKWYKEKDSPGNPQTTDAVAPVANACCIDYDLWPEQILKELERQGFLTTDRGTVTYNLPDSTAILELSRALETWNKYITCSLGQVSFKGYHLFADLIMKANQALQNSVAQKYSQYCDDQCTDKYPLFKRDFDGDSDESNGMSTRVDRLNIEEQDIADKVDNTESIKADDTVNIEADETESMQISVDFPHTAITLLPIELQPDIAVILVHLANTDDKPTSDSTLLELLKQFCSVTYVMSPKYILAQLFQSKTNPNMDTNAREHFMINLHLGSGVVTSRIHLRDTLKLANMLTFPGKRAKPSKKKPASNKHAHRHAIRHEPMDTSFSDTSGPGGVFQKFQLYIRKMSELKGQRDRSVLLLNATDAQQRCQERVMQWIDEMNANTNELMTAEAITQKLVQLCQEHVNLPTDMLVRLLEKTGYLEVKDCSIVYKLPYSKPVPNTNKWWDTFMTSWEPDLRKCETERRDKVKQGTSGAVNHNGRKRSLCPPDCSPKKARVVDII